MPLILRACHVNDLAEGVAIQVKVRGRKFRLVRSGGSVFAFDASGTTLPDHATPADVEAARRDGVPHRAVVRGSWVHVAVDADRERAPAEIQLNDRMPEVARL